MSRLDSYDLSYVRNRLQYKGMSAAHALRLEKAYKHYVALLIERPHEPLVMSEDIDEFVHEAVLDTRKYDAFQWALGGRLHHQPVANAQELEALSHSYHHVALPLVKQTNGDMELWGEGKQICLCTYVPNIPAPPIVVQAEVYPDRRADGDTPDLFGFAPRESHPLIC